MMFKLAQGTGRALEKAAWLGLAGVIAAACGGGSNNVNGQGGAGGTASSTTSSSSGTGGAPTTGSSSSAGGAPTTDSSSSAGGAGGTGSSSSTSSAGGAGGAGSASSSASSGSSSSSGGGSTHLAEWARGFLGTEQSAHSVATDAQGNIYVGGTFQNGKVDFGTGELDCPFTPGSKSECGFLLKLDPTGKTLWSRALVGARTLSIDVPALAVGADSILIAATWRRFQFPHDVLDLGTGPLDPPGDNPMVLARLDLNGKTLWSAAFGADAGEVVPSSVVIDGPDSFTVGGGFTTASLDLGAGPMAFVSARTLFVAHFNGTTPAWQQSFGAKNSAQELTGFGKSSTGELLLAGTFTQSLDFGSARLRSMGDWSIFRAKLDANGGILSAQSFDATGTFPSMTGVATDAAGSSLVTGLFDGTLSLGATPLVCQGNVNAYLARLGTQGDVLFTQASTEPDPSIDASFCAGADASSNMLWGARMVFLEQGASVFHGRITKLDPSGATLWSVADKNFGARAFAFDAAANVITVGDFSNRIDFAKNSPILATSGTNAFVAKFAP